MSFSSSTVFTPSPESQVQSLGSKGHELRSLDAWLWITTRATRDFGIESSDLTRPIRGPFLTCCQKAKILNEHRF
jgi:hypothetical protein